MRGFRGELEGDYLRQNRMKIARSLERDLQVGDRG